jgi:hypothetical protein
MSATLTRKTRWCWRKDLAEFRGLTDRERSGFLLVLEWFENFRLRHSLEAGREAAKAFWKSEVTREGREREKWSRKGLCPTRSIFVDSVRTHHHSIESP